MSFVAGFVTGLSTGGAAERRKKPSQFLKYMERRGYTVIDRSGKQIPLDKIANEALHTDELMQRRVLVTGVIVVAAVFVTGGSAWLLLSVV